MIAEVVMEQRLPFHQWLKIERERRGWSQAVLAEKVHSDYKTIYRWESGRSLPSPYHRQFICELFGINAEELGLLDRTTEKLLAQSPSHKEDWGDAPLGEVFYGRHQELDQLSQWIDDDRCRVVAILGIGGIGKTTLCAKVAERVKSSFDYIFWRSLQNTPPVAYFIKQCIQHISGQQRIDLPKEYDEQVTLLIHYLQKQRILLVLDNVESIMQRERHDGQYINGYEGYGRLFGNIGEAQHQSCLVLTSREKPKEVTLLEGRLSPIRTFYLSGIGSRESREILKEKELLGSEEQWTTLVDLYAGNPLALKLVSDSIRELFAGNIATFLQEGEISFGYIDELIGHQFQRLSNNERSILYWLAIEREAVPLETIYDDLAQHTLKSDVFAAVESLRRRFFLEVKEAGHFTLQPVIIEYVTNDLVRRACEEFAYEESELWANYAFSKAHSKDYLRESQERLILTPIARRLYSLFGREEIRQKLDFVLDSQRQKHALQRNYLASNVLKLCIHAGYNLQGADFSNVVIWQAYLQEAVLQGVNFAHAHFISSRFKSTFGNVLSVALSPQDDLLAMGTATGEVWLYHALSGVALTNYSGHTDGVWSVAFHPNGQILASSSDDQTIRLWDMKTGNCMRVLQEHTNRIRSVAFSPDGHIFASSSDDQTVRLWDVKTGRCLRVLKGHVSRVWSVSFSPDGCTLATGSTDETIRLWNVSTGDCFKTLVGHAGWIRAVAYSPQGEILASSSDDQTIRLWDVDSGNNLKVLHDHTNRVWSLAFHPEGTTLVSGSEDHSIRIWDIKSGNCVNVLQGHTYGVRSLALSLDGKKLVSGGDDQTIRVWDIRSGSCLKTLQGYTNRIWSLAFHFTSNTLASISEDPFIRIWTLPSATCTKMVQSHTHRAKIVTFSPDGTLLASGGEDQTVRLWERKTGRCLHILKGHTNWVRAVAFSPDGRRLASGSEDHTIRLWDLDRARCITVLHGHTSWIRSVIFSLDGRMIISAGDDHSIRLWNTETGSCLAVLQGHTGRVRGIAFHPKEAILASGSEDQTVRLWNLAEGKNIAILRGHTNWVRTVAFSPDGKFLASGGDDPCICLWKLEDKRCTVTLRGHTHRVRSLIFARDEQTLLSGSDDGTIKLWNIQTAECLQTLVNERPYEGMNITMTSGLTEAQKEAFRSLGAFEENL